MSLTTDSIFYSIRRLLGPSEDDPGFDSDIMDFINSEFLTLHQLGLGPADFSITGPEQTWGDYTQDKSLIHAAKNYIYLKAKKQFDPSGSSTVNECQNDKIAELEFRMNIQAEGDAAES